LVIRDLDRDSPKSSPADPGCLCRTVSKLSEKLSLMFIADPDFFLFRITDPGVKKHRIRIRNITIKPGFARILIRIQRNMDPQHRFSCSLSHDGLFLFSLSHTRKSFLRSLSKREHFHNFNVNIYDCVSRNERHVQIAMRRRQALEHTPFPKVYPKKWATWCNQVPLTRFALLSKRIVDTKTKASLREGSPTIINDSVFVK
jgi:hypothetical protein